MDFTSCSDICCILLQQQALDFIRLSLSSVQLVGIPEAMRELEARVLWGNDLMLTILAAYGLVSVPKFVSHQVLYFMPSMYHDSIHGSEALVAYRHTISI
jgi:hypothetical protein